MYGGGSTVVCTACGWIRDCVYRLWMGASDGDSDGSARATSGAQDPERGPNNPFLYLIVTRRGERRTRQAGHFHEWVVMNNFTDTG